MELVITRFAEGAYFYAQYGFAITKHRELRSFGCSGYCKIGMGYSVCNEFTSISIVCKWTKCWRGEDFLWHAINVCQQLGYS
jgi:hypothetical protein